MVEVQRGRTAVVTADRAAATELRDENRLHAPPALGDSGAAAGEASHASIEPPDMTCWAVNGAIDHRLVYTGRAGLLRGRQLGAARGDQAVLSQPVPDGRVAHAQPLGHRANR